MLAILQFQNDYAKERAVDIIFGALIPKDDIDNMMIKEYGHWESDGTAQAHGIN